MEEHLNQILEIEYPELLKGKLDYLIAQFPAAVDYDEEERAVTFREEFPRDVSIAVSYLRLVSEVNEVIQNCNFVIKDMCQLPTQEYTGLRECLRRYYLLNRVFFYELLRVRDSLGRHLKRDEDLGFFNKSDRRKAKQMLDEQFEEHYLIRNVYLHGHKLPKSDIEHELDLIVSAFENGYQLVPKGEKQAINFQKKFNTACNARSAALLKIGSDVRDFLNTIVHFTAQWTNHKLNEEQESNNAAQPDAAEPRGWP